MGLEVPDRKEFEVVRASCVLVKVTHELAIELTYLWYTWVVHVHEAR